MSRPPSWTGTRRSEFASNLADISLCSTLVSSHPLCQLEFAIAMYLQLASFGEDHDHVSYPMGMPSLDHPKLTLRPGIRSPLPGGRTTVVVHADVLNPEGAMCSFVQFKGEVLTAAGRVRRQIWHGLALLAFRATYRGEVIELVYVRYMETAGAVAAHANRPLSRDESRACDFPMYRWQLHPGAPSPGLRGHPAALGPYYGVIAAKDVLGPSPMLPTSATYTSTDPLFLCSPDMARFSPNRKLRVL